MPTPSADRVQKRVETLKKKIAASGAKMDGDAARKARKSLKRAQRKRRRLVVAAKRTAPKSAEEASA